MSKFLIRAALVSIFAQDVLHSQLLKWHLKQRNPSPPILEEECPIDTLLQQDRIPPHFTSN